MKKFTIYFLFTVCTLMSCNFEDQSNQNGNLILNSSFGNSGESMLVNPTNFDTNKEDYIFVSDPGVSQIYQFDLEGEFIRKIGNPGQGPEEFINQSVISFSEDKIHVQDQSNMRLHVIDTYGNFEKIIPQEDRAFVSFSKHKGNYIGFAPTSFLKSHGLENESLFKVFDSEWNLINEFGNYIIEPDNIPAGMSWPFFKISNNKIYSVFAYFPIMEVYDLKGSLEESYHLDKINDFEIDQRNLSEQTYSDMSNPQMNSVNRSIDVVENEIYVLRWDQSLTIDKYVLEDESIRFENTFWYSETNENYYPLDFFFVENEELFYVLEINNEGVPQVAVYSLV
ncbi:BF3164 family lipoprotein [Rhodohalobacter sp.]|uniref:BF3164 family lipoprotein n=1 Tax=Rhodohalobacter sp. TaxID=1974210 RepID=UPI0035671388